VSFLASFIEIHFIKSFKNGLVDTKTNFPRMIFGWNTLLIFSYFCRCEAFSTYPRTYDWIHVSGLFTAESHRYILEISSALSFAFSFSFYFVEMCIMQSKWLELYFNHDKHHFHLI
jgi:hypothetical protein